MGFSSRVAAIAGGVAFVLSFIIGLVNGIQVGAVLLRALLCAAGFAVFSVVVMLIFSRFLQTGARYDIEDAGEDGDIPATGAGNTIDFYDTDDSAAPARRATEQMSSFLDNNSAGEDDGADGNEEEFDFSAGNQAARIMERGTTRLGDAGTDRGVEQKNDTGYTYTEEQSMPKADINDGFSFNMSDFVPGLPTNADAPPLPGGDPVNSFEMGSVEMSVGKNAPGKKIELSDLGSDADGKKIARTIQTLLKKDDG